MDKLNNTNFPSSLPYSGGSRTSNSRIIALVSTTWCFRSPATMADSTHSKTTLDRIEEVVAKLASSHLHFSEKLDDLINRVVALENTPHHSSSLSSSSANPAPQPQTLNPHRLKLDVPRFYLYGGRVEKTIIPYANFFPRQSNCGRWTNPHT